MQRALALHSGCGDAVAAGCSVAGAACRTRTPWRGNVGVNVTVLVRALHYCPSTPPRHQKPQDFA